MPAITPPPAKGSLIQWALTHQAEIRQLVEEHNNLVEARLVLVAADRRETQAFGAAKENFELRIPLRFNSAVDSAPAYAGGSVGITYNGSVQTTLNEALTQVAALTTTVNALLAQLRLNGQNPR